MLRKTKTVGEALKSSEHTLHDRHIVLVFDVADTAEETVMVLLKAGFDAIAVESASAMLALMDTGVEPCVLVLDADTPEADAWKVWDSVRERDEESRPAAVLVSTDVIDGTRARVVGIREFLRKPIAPQGLVEAVERHCPRRLWPKFVPADADHSSH